jgi:hypothetical protein
MGFVYCFCNFNFNLLSYQLGFEVSDHAFVVSLLFHLLVDDIFIANGRFHFLLTSE